MNNIYTENENLVGILAASNTVSRYHNVATLKENNLASHQYGVAMLCYLLCKYESDRSGVTVNLLMAALDHDLPEVYYGDPPAPVKRIMSDEARKNLEEAESAFLIRFGMIAHMNLTDTEEHILKLADRLEGMLFCFIERGLGNKFIVPVYNKFKKYANEEGLLTYQEESVYREIEAMWETVE